MRLASIKSALGLLGFFALCTALVGCPEKGGGAADKATAEPEHAEPDDQGKLDEKTKKPAAAAPAPAAAPAAAPGEEKKEKDEGGW
jgi:hypothetical protein